MTTTTVTKQLVKLLEQLSKIAATKQAALSPNKSAVYSENVDNVHTLYVTDGHCAIKVNLTGEFTELLPTGLSKLPVSSLAPWLTKAKVLAKSGVYESLDSIAETQGADFVRDIQRAMRTAAPKLTTTSLDPALTVRVFKILSDIGCKQVKIDMGDDGHSPIAVTSVIERSDYNVTAVIMPMRLPS